MKSKGWCRLVFPHLPIIGLLTGSLNLAYGQFGGLIPFSVRLWYPIDGQTFLAPADIGLQAVALDSNVVEKVEYFSGPKSLGIVTNSGNVWPLHDPFFLVWSNVLAGNYTLTAVATDSAGIMATSPPVNISVVTSTPPVAPFVVRITHPEDGDTFPAPASFELRSHVVDSNVVQTVEYFSGTTSLGIVSNTGGIWHTDPESHNSFSLVVSNVAAGTYTLTAVATDSAGVMATSPPVNISVVTPTLPVVPFAVRITHPEDGDTFRAPATFELRSQVADSNAVQTVEYFSGTTSLGIVTNTGATNPESHNPFSLAVSNVAAGNYTLTAVATDSAGIMATSPPVNISVVTPTPPVVPFVVQITHPEDGDSFPAPATFELRSQVVDSNVVRTVEYFSGTTSLGIVSNTSGILLTNPESHNPFSLVVSNVAAGNYILTAVATDSAGTMATSPPVKISVVTPTPPVVPFVVQITHPEDGDTFPAPATFELRSQVVDSNVVHTVEYFSGTTSLGIVSNTGGILLTNPESHNPFSLVVSNVAAGNYTLTAVATDSAGIMATSPPVKISVVTPTPPVLTFVVHISRPTDGQTFLAPANIGLRALVVDSNLVKTVAFFSGAMSIGTVSNAGGVWPTNSESHNPFSLTWSNVLAGNYTLTAVAVDSTGIMATSPPVSISVVTSLPPVVRIYAPDPVAIEGTNFNPLLGPVTNTATLLVWRDGPTNADLTVQYNISGTATNGVDYATIPDSVTVAAGQRYAPITILPLSDQDSAFRHFDTVVLTLTPPSATPPTYMVGSPGKAGAIILEENLLPISGPVIRDMPDHSVYLSLPAPDGMSFALETSPDLVTWQSVCTNTVLKGSAQFVDPDGSAGTNLFYRILPTQ